MMAPVHDDALHDSHAIEQLEQAFLDPVLADRVDSVVRPLGGERYRVASRDGSVEFERLSSDGRHGYRTVATTGRDPLVRIDDDALLGLQAEESDRWPTRDRTSFPHAFDSIAQFFDSSVAPNLYVNHTAAHTREGHLGHHGSLGIVQARAPFIAAGAGVRPLGVLDRSTRVVDVAPTIAALLDLDAHPDAVGPTGERRLDGRLRRQDGDPITDVLTGDRAEQMVVVLLDGCNANLLHDVVDAGEAPHLADLIGRGVAMRRGSFASLPTATLANHTTAVTGAHPGHSGVLHNAWVDRSDGAQPDLLSMEEMFWSSGYVRDDVETLFEALARSRPGAFSSATFEFCDRGADFSSFGLVRAGSGERLPSIDDVVHVDRSCAARSGAYSFMSCVDHVSLAHTVSCWNQEHGNPLPALTWCSLAVTDEAGHESGPHGELARAAVLDSDARLGELVATVERAGELDRTAFVVIADHGMEQSDPDVDRPWEADLADCGIPHRIVGDGLVYVEWT